jgi:hypothetical protein
VGYWEIVHQYSVILPRDHIGGRHVPTINNYETAVDRFSVHVFLRVGFPEDFFRRVLCLIPRGNCRDADQQQADPDAREADMPFASRKSNLFKYVTHDHPVESWRESTRSITTHAQHQTCAPGYDSLLADVMH